ncbi:MAG: iron donor protein CyaY [Alphaproteobacteria bacterium]|nr:iron donor protein CyaY [Alphaproteobacteria bacterium]
MMTESEFHTLADALLEQMADALEDADSTGDIEVDLEGSVLSIALSSGKQYLVSKHAPSRQMWVSSPASGGLHFSYMDEKWALADGRELLSFVAGELKTLGNIEVVF